MISLQQSVLIFTTLALCLSSAFALKCYKCDSNFDKSCLDPFNNERVPLDECEFVRLPRYLEKWLPLNANATACMKAVTEDADGNKHIARSCFFGDIESKSNGCQPDPRHPFAKQISCDVCTEDTCNDL